MVNSEWSWFLLNGQQLLGLVLVGCNDFLCTRDTVAPRSSLKCSCFRRDLGRKPCDYRPAVKDNRKGCCHGKLNGVVAVPVVSRFGKPRLERRCVIIPECERGSRRNRKSGVELPHSKTIECSGSSRWKSNLATRSRHHSDHAAFHLACPGGSESGCRARC